MGLIKEFPTINKIPATKIGRYAIDEKYTKKGLGSVILLNVVKNIEIISENIGLRYITVDAYATAYDFYRKNNFNHFQISSEINKVNKLEKIKKHNPEQTILMYQDLKIIYTYLEWNKPF